MKKKKIIRIFVAGVVVIPVLSVLISGVLVYVSQDRITKHFIATLNEDFHGTFTIGGSHISPFANFPYISVDMEDFKFFETKDTAQKPVFEIDDMYIGFDLWTIASGDFQIKSIKLDHGIINLVTDTAGELNILKGLKPVKEIESAEEEFNLYLKEIDLVEIDIFKLDESTGMLAEVFVEDAHSEYQMSGNYTKSKLDARFLFNLISEGDTTFLKHKHFDISTSFEVDHGQSLITVAPSRVRFESGNFGLKGTLDLGNDLDLDIELTGNKPNFDLLLAFAPEEVVPVLESYNNKGEVYLEAKVEGKSINGHSPKLEARFGCADAMFRNITSQKTLDEMSFKGYFTNGESRDITTMEITIMDFSAKPETGTFTGFLKVKNFESPEIDIRVNSDFNLEFLAGFLELTELEDLKGSVDLTMNFHDVIDLANPEKTLENFNESYYTELNVRGLGFKIPRYHLPFEDINIKAVMDGHAANIEEFTMRAGKTELSLSGKVSDLPAVIHHLDKKVKTDIAFRSKRLDFKELTSGDTARSKPFDEVFEDFSMKLAFESTAKELAEFTYLPEGEFFIDELNGKFKNYPHALHDFFADIYIEENDLRIVDFKGMVDESDFAFSGGVHNYRLWFDDAMRGNTEIEIDLTSNKLQLKDLFSYGGENYVPEDYRDEEFKELNVKAHAELHFDSVLHAADIYLDRLYGFMHVHPLKLRGFSGHIHKEGDHYTIRDFGGKIGNTDFKADADYYTGKREKRDVRNFVLLRSDRLDFDELMNYAPAAPDEEVDHDDVFNIYEIPFPDVEVTLDLKRLNYHRYLIEDFYSKFRLQKDHYIYIDTAGMEVAEGKLEVKGYFNGSDPAHIYLNPDVRMEEIDIDRVMVKFDNFGQDAIVSDNLHGKISGRITGKVRMHADMVPIIDESELHIDLRVTEGRLDNYGPMELLADYFSDKNLNRVKFDTLNNHIDVENGVMQVPAMTINSTLGYIEVSGRQELAGEMEYFVRVPLKMVTKAGMNRLFKRRKEIDEDRDDEIIRRDKSRRTSFINLKISGTPENYKISTGKDKSGEES